MGIIHGILWYYGWVIMLNYILWLVILIIYRKLTPARYCRPAMFDRRVVVTLLVASSLYMY
jgi:hypothetical protein